MVDISRFKELGQDKLTIMLRILSSKGLCKAIEYNDTNFLDKSDIADPSILIYDHIFPYNRIPDAITESKTFVTFSFRDYRPVGSYFRSGLIHINIMVHKDSMRTDYGVLRTDYILSEIDSLMERGIGIGKTEFFKSDEFNVNADYLGVYVAYKIVEFR